MTNYRKMTTDELWREHAHLETMIAAANAAAPSDEFFVAAEDHEAGRAGLASLRAEFAAVEAELAGRG